MYLPKTELLLPLTQVFPGADSTKNLVSTIDKDFIFEGNPTRTMQQFVRRVLSRTIYHAILGSRASEHSARMIAMSNATDNAEALQTQLELEYNKVRQQSITNDMLDIVSGANAQKQGA